MSDTYWVAARLTLTKKQLTAWLRAEAGSAVLVDRPTLAPMPLVGPEAKQVKHQLALGVKRMAQGEGEGLLVSQQTGVVWVVHVVTGDAQPLAPTLLALAAAGAHRTRKQPDHALVLAETSARLRPGAVLAVLEIGKGRAGFVDPAAATDRMEAFAPAEALFHEALAHGLDRVATEARFVHPQVRQAARIPKPVEAPPSFARPADWLEAIEAATSTPWGPFQRSIEPLAAQASGFGVDTADALLELMEHGSWEAGVIAYWSLLDLSLSAGDPSFARAAQARMDAWEAPKAGRGWVLGGPDALQRRHRALAGGDPIASLVRELRVGIQAYREGGLSTQLDLAQLLFYEHGALEELAALAGWAPRAEVVAALRALPPARRGLVFYWYFDPGEARAMVDEGDGPALRAGPIGP